MAQFICGSTHLLLKLSVSTRLEIASLMQQVLTFDPMELRAYEVEEGVYWQTFLKCVEFLYFPSSSIDVTNNFADGLEIKELHQLGIGMLLHYLQSALGKNEHVEIMVEEKLVDFIIALPWNIPNFHEDKAKHVVRELAKIYPVQPLSLSSLAKAKLAKSTWGLKKIMEIQSFQELI